MVTDDDSTVGDEDDVNETLEDGETENRNTDVLH